jgi:UPF0716 protein FxsA
MGKLLLLFIALPAVELALLIELGRRIGTLETLALIIVTGVVGATLARSQGLRVLSNVQAQLGAGKMPAESLLDGLMILIASALLVTPGVLTDAFGFLCLTPAFRTVARRAIVRRFKRSIEEGKLNLDVRFRPGGQPGDPWPRDPRDPIIDVTPKPPTDQG